MDLWGKALSVIDVRQGRAISKAMWLMGTTALVALWAAGPVAAQARVDGAPALVAQADVRTFNIPAQSLASALTTFGQQSGFQVTVDSAILSGLRSQPVSGSLSADAALRQMLSGTGLTWYFSDSRTVALERMQAESGVVELPPITVFGEKMGRSLKDTATSVTVFDQETLEQRPRLDSTNDVFARLPNVTATGTTNFAPTIRGVNGTGPAEGGNAFFAGTRPRLTTQVDGRPVSYNELVFGDVSLWDVEQVEVLRGPQSTLQGRNSIAGTTVIKTNDPTYDWEGSVRAIVGNMDTRQGSFYVSGPLIDDQLAFRVAVDRKTSESFVNGMVAVPGVDDPREFESTTVRGKLLIEPKGIPGFSTLLTLNHSDVTGPQTEELARPFDNHVTSYPAMPIFNPRATTGIAETTWDWSDQLTFRNTASYTDLLIKRLANPGEGIAKIDGYEALDEPRLQFSSVDKRVKGIAGVYVFKASQDEVIDVGGDNRFHDSTTTMAAYGEVTVGVLDDVDLTLGGRLEQENRRRLGGLAPTFDIDLDETYRVFLPKAGLAWHTTPDLTLGATVSRGYNGGGGGVTLDPPFVSYAYDPEYVWNYELYARQDLYGGKLSLTGNLFLSKYKDMQLPFTFPGTFSSIILNADKTQTYGLELGAKWRPIAGLEIFGDLGLLKTDIESFSGAPELEGNDLPQSPTYTVDVGASYRHTSGLDLGVDARFSDGYYSTIDNHPRGKTDPYWVVNAQLGYNFESLRVFAFVNNVFDSGEPVYISPGVSAADDVASILQPRTIGIGIQAWF